ncbi:NUMOD1 domain-containing DNA-binding protein [Parapedobacter indicus]|uniref:NUMOD1 domain-containing protein n=1 Tax=Parapedobacter indicus TaxID=1477437 RepID=A0A1I3JWU5_9SPHI|nr:NUMOD1 domain-containing DNA-binding protein [Parapedobacter indicus]PPL01628.1 NUMOD1 domain-containing protein [Parapedobacter indicus]SFI64425.1 NUMOD1 domain-containing protein [Parapedobacter indicus]
MKKTQYPFQDLSQGDLRGEHWKDIPQLEGYYQISNKGRVRRIAHCRTTASGACIPVPGLMLCQQTKSTYNSFTQDYRFNLRFSATVNKKRHYITTARMVYYCFVEPFDLTDSRRVVLYKDNDSLNVSAENLELSNPSEKFARMVKQSRWKNSFAELDQATKKAMRQKAKQHYAQTGVHEISQYDLEGNFIRTYPDASEASKAVKISASHISSAAKNRGTYTAGGYIWRRGKASPIDMAELMNLPGIHLSPLAKNLRRIGQYDLQGNLVQTYATIAEACSKLGMNSSSSLRAVLNGKRHTCKGYVWRRGDAAHISINNIASGRSFRLSALSAEARKVTQYNFDGIRMRTFNNVHMASRETGINRSTIQRVLSGRYVTGGGYLWQYGEALRMDLRPLKKHPRFDQSKLGIYMEEKREQNKRKKEIRLLQLY